MRLHTIFFATMLLCSSLFCSARQTNLILSTENTSLGISTNPNASYVQYYGARLDNAELTKVFATKSNYTCLSYPTFGYSQKGGNFEALSVVMPDGNQSAELAVTNTEETTDAQGKLVVVTMKDKYYPLQVKQYFKAYNGTDVISIWTEITNLGKKDILLRKFASTMMGLQRGENYVYHMHGKWARENYLEETLMPNGELVLNEKEGMRTAWYNNPSFMVSVNGKPTENEGEVFGGTIMWGGNYKIELIGSNSNLRICAGINPENSSYTLEGGETFKTPEFAMTYSIEGKGGVSRAFHKWARKYALQHGDTPRDILLNSWEGVYFNVNQEGMSQMMKDIADLGGELFVMDDGWFGGKWARNDGTMGLGDWFVNTKKLPLGVEGLVKAAKENKVKFGIWIEPEMVNTQSELYEKHPDWVMQCPNRTLSTGRGKTQAVLDLSNPKVQDFVFSITDNLLSKNPEIAYIKWDCNAALMDYGSTYLPTSKQSELDIRYHMGLRNVLERIRAKYKDVVIQCCSSGGGRISYGFLPWFDEFWGSDNTDACDRVFMQWNHSQFYPAIAMACHVSASPNHQTKRETPFKFRFDVAMSGRLGIEMQPRQMSEKEQEFAKRAIAGYKQIRDVVQMGDLYRLISPYDHKCISSLMYASEDKSHLALFAYAINYNYEKHTPVLRLTGADENKNYRIKDLTPWEKDKPCAFNDKVVSGRVLKYSGLQVKDVLKGSLQSLVLEFIAE